jgi:hypothetical protein
VGCCTTGGKGAASGAAGRKTSGAVSATGTTSSIMSGFVAQADVKTAATLKVRMALKVIKFSLSLFYYIFKAALGFPIKPVLFTFTRKWSECGKLDLNSAL